MARLAERLEEFASALLDPERAVPEGLVGPDSEPSARRFAVYRNNVFVGLTDALRAGFPCVVKLVGDEYFAAMARVFAAAMPPGSPVLLHYGAEFPDFIASFPPGGILALSRRRGPHRARRDRGLPRARSRAVGTQRARQRIARPSTHAAVSASPFRAPGALAIPSLHDLADERPRWHAGTR
ncbi:DNA-binding domain-containing protein [Pseudomonas aeruginosa]|uniref:DNA-binding domain-containing protein n=1 Tax=Pseudomonas aeruginosa TaxID=287 RepID=UPI002EDACADD